jgi:hypothetical protein
MGAACASTAFVTVNKTARCHNPEDHSMTCILDEAKSGLQIRQKKVVEAIAAAAGPSPFFRKPI